MKKKTVALTMLIIAVAAVATGAAFAATVGGDGTLVGTPQNDTLNAGNANDTVYGLAGSDTINVGNGNDLLNGDGQCPAGDQGQDFPGGMGSNDCENNQNQDQNGQKDTINAGNGNDVVFGGGGHNTINVGSGIDTIYAGPVGDTIATGVGGTAYIYLCGTSGAIACTGGGNTVAVGGHSNGGGTRGVVYARNGVADTISCSGSNTVTVYADRFDTVKGCATVVRSARDIRRRVTRRRTRHHHKHRAKRGTGKRSQTKRSQTKRSQTF